MIVISDSNILMSGLYNPNGTIVKILTSKSKIQFLAPQYLFEEIEEHIAKISDYTKKSRREILEDLKRLTAGITIINIENISPENKKKSFDLTFDIDLDDAPFVALHLHTGHKIWTGGIHLIKGLLKKGYDICVTTEELKKFLYKKD